ncbi:hypothetical protein LSAT2_014579 [Lamellibrachia satsuma]|nr:hypothetical protein LSAT2_014579 [Lamellibrachia satsuma]
MAPRPSGPVGPASLRWLADITLDDIDQCKRLRYCHEHFPIPGVQVEPERDDTVTEGTRSSFWFRLPSNINLADVTSVGIVMAIKGTGRLSVSINTTAAYYDGSSVTLLTMQKTTNVDAKNAASNNIVCRHVVGDVRQMKVGDPDGGGLWAQVWVSVACAGGNRRQACTTSPKLQALIFLVETDVSGSGCRNVREHYELEQQA